MTLAELPGMISKHINMTSAGQGMAPPPSASMQQMNKRQNTWSSAAQSAINTRSDIYNKTIGDDRPLLEHLAGVSDETKYAVDKSEELLPKEAQAQHDHNSSDTPDDATNGDLDTLRHTLLSAKLAQMHPTIAKAALQFHEISAGTLTGKLSRETMRDTRNNAQGMKLGENIGNGLEQAASGITAVMSNKTALDYMPLGVMAQRQGAWGELK